MLTVEGPTDDTGLWIIVLNGAPRVGGPVRRRFEVEVPLLWSAETVTPSRASSSEGGGCGEGQGGGGERGWMGAMSKEDSSSGGRSVSEREGRGLKGEGVR